MKLFCATVTALFVVATTAAIAQPAPQYAPPDRELWDAMVRELGEVPMTARSHRQTQDILQNVQREAASREARSKQTKAPPPAAPAQ